MNLKYLGLLLTLLGLGGATPSWWRLVSPPPLDMGLSFLAYLSAWRESAMLRMEHGSFLLSGIMPIMGHALIFIGLYLLLISWLRERSKKKTGSV